MAINFNANEKGVVCDLTRPHLRYQSYNMGSFSSAKKRERLEQAINSGQLLYCILVVISAAKISHYPLVRTFLE